MVSNSCCHDDGITNKGSFAGGRYKAAESKKFDGRLAVRKLTKKEKKAAKDPNKEKRSSSAFFVFMEDFRKQYKESHPNNKSVAAGGEEKTPFQSTAEKRKAEYERKMEAYNRKLAGEADEEYDKSKSEVHDEDEDEDGSGGEEDKDDD